MIKRCIGIDLTQDNFHAVQISRKGDLFKMEKILHCPMRRTSDSPAELLQSLLRKHEFDCRATTAVAMSENNVFYHSVKSRHNTPEKPGRHLPSSAGDICNVDLPIQKEQAVIDFCQQQNITQSPLAAIAASTEKDSINQRLDIFKKAGIRHDCLDTTAFALHASAVINHPRIRSSNSIILFSNNHSVIMVLSSQDEIIMARDMPTPDTPDDNFEAETNAFSELCREIDITWRRATDRNIPKNTVIILAGKLSQQAEFRNILEKTLSCTTLILDPCAQISSLEPNSNNSEICIAQGLALRGLAPDKTQGINFLKVIRENIREKFNTKKEAYLCLALTLITILAYVTGLLVQKYRLENQYSKIKNEMRLAFQSTLPGEQNIVDELAQLTAALNAKRKENILGKIAVTAPLYPLDIFQLIAKHTPPSLGININSTWITENSVRISAGCDTFAIAYQWQDHLKTIPQVSQVELLNPLKDKNTDGNQKVNFTLSITFMTESSNEL